MIIIMKNTYKYIIASVALSAAALGSANSVQAQNLPNGVYLEQDGICFRKTATKDDDDASVYHIDLEAFVKGAVTYTESADPSDIVLVLDVSGSMTSTITSYEYDEATTPTNVTYNNRNQNLESNNNQRYVKYGDGYYRVRVGRYETGGHWQGWSYIRDYCYYLYFNDDNTQYFIDNTGGISTTRPENVTDAGTNLLSSSVQLYTRRTVTKTRLKALQEASEAFISEVVKNAKYDKRGALRENPLDNKIAIVKFGGNGGDNSYYNNDDDAYEEDGNGNHTFPNSSYNYTEVVRGLKSVLTDSTDLKNAINALTASGATSADHGMVLAKNIIDHIPADRVSNKTVVFFTDGDPTHGSDFSSTVALAAIGTSNEIKAITYGSGDNATHPIVFSVGVFTTAPQSTDNIYRFMDRISSNFKNAASLTNGTRESSDFYKDASGGAADLTAIFKAIASSASTPGSTIGSSSAVTVDVVTNSFSVPANAQDAELEVLVAPCTGLSDPITYGGETKQYLTFGDPVDPADIAGFGTITATVDPATNTVSTTGFDFSANFCGPDNSTNPPTYRGWKQIIRFKITVRDDAVGGPNVATNDAKSGIYVNGEQIAEFNRPTVKLPVQIWIQKTGLVGDDSAVFTLYATPYIEGQAESVYKSDDYKDNWTTFTKVIVNNENMVEVDDPNNPGQKVKVRKLVGLDPDYFYKLKEDAWAFGYQYQDGDGIVYTIGDNIGNPIEIKNTPKDIPIDEATVRNVFKEKKASTSGSGASE